MEDKKSEVIAKKASVGLLEDPRFFLTVFCLALVGASVMIFLSMKMATDLFSAVLYLFGFGMAVGGLFSFLYFNLPVRYMILRRFSGKNIGSFFDLKKGGIFKRSKIDFNLDAPEVDGIGKNIPKECVGTWMGMPIAFGNAEDKNAIPLYREASLDPRMFAIGLEKEQELARAKERAKGMDLKFILQVISVLLSVILVILLIMVLGEVQKTAPLIIQYINSTRAVVAASVVPVV